MKRLLSIIAAVGLTATVSSTVVACGTTKEDDNTFSKLDVKYQEQVVMRINGVDITLRDILGDKKSAYDSDVMAFLNEKVAKEYTNDYYGKQFSSYMNLANTGKEESEKQVDDLFTSSATLDLFVKYLESIHSGKPMDKGETYLNPIIYNGKNLKRDRDDLESEYSIWFKSTDGDSKYKRWTVNTEVTGIDITSESKVEESIPSVDQLSNGTDFILVNNLYTSGSIPLSDSSNDDESSVLTNINGTYSLKTLYGEGGSGSDAISIDEGAIIKSNLTGQEALGLRMQQNIYKNNSQNMSDVMVMQYLKSKAYTAKKGSISADIDKLSNESDKGLYLNLSSSFAKGVQTWKTSSDNEPDIKSNYKMVWKFTVDGTDENRNKINDAINGVKDLNIKTEKYSRFSREQKIDEIAKIFSSEDKPETFSSSSKEINDPFFGISGFQGIVKDGQSVSGGVLDIKDEDAKNQIANVEGLGILTSAEKNSANYSRTYNFVSKDSSKDDYIVVMPLYLADLLRTNPSHTSENQPKQLKEDEVVKNQLTGIATGEWVEVNPQGYGWGWDSKSKIELKDTKGDEEKTFDIKKDGEKTFMKFAAGHYGEKAYLKINGNTDVTVTSESKPDENDTTYGYEGIYSKSPENVTKDDAKLLANNGKRVKYKIHLGVDSTVPDNYEQSWIDSSSAGNGTPIDEVANLKASQKEDIINTLLLQVAKSDTGAQESAKYELYPKYIDLENIYYKATKDELSKYIKKDDDKIDEEDW